jgi:hypothetical protein
MVSVSVVTVVVQMNIQDVKNKIAEYEQSVADDAGVTIQRLAKIRTVVRDTFSRRAEIVAKRRNSKGRLLEMRARHAQEIAALNAEISGFDGDAALIDHIAEVLEVNKIFVVSFIQGAHDMDEEIRRMWADYRSQR